MNRATNAGVLSREELLKVMTDEQLAEFERERPRRVVNMRMLQVTQNKRWLMGWLIHHKRCKVIIDNNAKSIPEKSREEFVKQAWKEAADYFWFTTEKDSDLRYHKERLALFGANKRRRERLVSQGLVETVSG